MIDHLFAQKLMALRQRIKKTQPLVHCITNPISINDCANAILAIGSRPIMVEHPAEAAEITTSAAALCLNLGSITEARLQAMKLSSEAANKNNIPIILDTVGASCSSFRKNLLGEFIPLRKPQIIKGNISEILAVCGMDCHSSGVEANSSQLINKDNAEEYSRLLSSWAKKNSTVLLVSGPMDYVTDGSVSYLIKNGVPMMGNITGTGCMLNALAAAYAPGGFPIEAALLAVLSFGIAGEIAAKHSTGPGTFHMQLFDALYNLTDADIITKGKITEL